MDNNEVYALFEDIRNGLKGINDRLENAPKVNNSQSGEQAPAMDLAPIKDLFDSSVKEHQQQTKAMLTKFGEAEVNASNRILHLLRDLKEMFVRNSEERADEPQHLGQHRALAVQAAVCGRCLEVPRHPLMGRLRRKNHPLAERSVRLKVEQITNNKK